MPELSVVIPARNEEGCLVETLDRITGTLAPLRTDYEIIVVDDHSTDATVAIVREFQRSNDRIKLCPNRGANGFGMTVRAGLEAATGEFMVIMMADGSDSPEDLVRYLETARGGYDCVFGSRFIKGGRVLDYPIHKLLVNRMANFFIRMLFGLRYNDVTNAFKGYSREAVRAMQPLISPHFNLTVEMPLKAIVRGFSFKVIPISWTNRKAGVSKLKIKEMGSRYLFVVLYIWLEKFLARGDYHRTNLRAGEEADREVGARHA